MNTDPIKPGRRIAGYGYVGSLSLDCGNRLAKHASVGRTNHKRKLTKRQRTAGQSDLRERLESNS